MVLRVLGDFLRAGRAVADILQPGGVGVVVAVEQLADLADAGVGEDRRVDAGGNLLRLDAVPRRGVVDDLEHNVDLVADFNGGNFVAGRVGDGVGRDIDAVGRGGVDGGRRRGRRDSGGIAAVVDDAVRAVIRQHRRTERRRQQ